MVKADWKQAKKGGQTPMVRFYLPLEPTDLDEPVCSLIRKLSDKIGEQLTGGRSKGHRCGA